MLIADSINEREFTCIEEAIYPEILDEDPRKAASSLTINRSEYIYEAFKNLFEDIKQNKKTKYFLLYEALSYSEANYEWFSKFFNSLETIIVGKKITEIPEVEITNKDASNTPVIHYPFAIMRNEKIIVAVDRKSNKYKDVIEDFRTFYISKSFMSSDFRGGYPYWIVFEGTNVFEVYDERVNTRVRIDYKNGEFYYFISGASDNWQQIIEVPLEMDTVVSVLLFRH